MTQTSQNILTSTQGPHPDMHYERPTGLIVMQSKGRTHEDWSTKVFDQYMDSLRFVFCSKDEQNEQITNPKNQFSTKQQNHHD